MTLGDRPPNGQRNGIGSGGLGSPANRKNDGEWGTYTEFKEKVYEPVNREIWDRFKYADLSDPMLRQLVGIVCSLGNIQLTCSANQYTIKVERLHMERDVIVEVLAEAGLPIYRPELEEDGFTLVEPLPNPAYEGNRRKRPQDDEDEDVDPPPSDDEEAEGEEAMGQLDDDDEDEDEEPPFIYDLPLAEDDEMVLDRVSMAEDNPNIWYVPLTPRDCWDRLAAIRFSLESLHRERVQAERDGVFYDAGPLLKQLQMPPEERERGDVTYMYPFFYQEAFALAAITAEDLHGHLQAVNANTVQERYGGTFINPNSAMPYGMGRPEGPPAR